jgi:hypothetical protein
MFPLPCFRSGLIAGVFFWPVSQAFKPVRFKFAPKTAQVNMCLLKLPLDAVKERTRLGGISYTRLVCERLERKARAFAAAWLDPLEW